MEKAIPNDAIGSILTPLKLLQACEQFSWDKLDSVLKGVSGMDVTMDSFSWSKYI